MIFVTDNLSEPFKTICQLYRAIPGVTERQERSKQPSLLRIGRLRASLSDSVHSGNGNGCISELHRVCTSCARGSIWLPLYCIFPVICQPKVPRSARSYRSTDSLQTGCSLPSFVGLMNSECTVRCLIRVCYEFRSLLSQNCRKTTL